MSACFYWKRFGREYAWYVTRTEVLDGVAKHEVVSGVTDDAKLRSFVWALGWAELGGRV